MESKKILVVDDDYDVLESCLLMLADEGHHVIGASNGSEAVEKYFEFEPDIVFMDIRMPGMDGYEAFLRIHRRDGDARVVFTSSYALDEQRHEHVRGIASVGMIDKPVAWRDLKRMMGRHSR